MNAIVIEHVPLAELPAKWRAKLEKPTGATVTVRIEEEVQAAAPAEEFVTDDPAFGIWRDREDMADVEAYVRKLRAPRYARISPPSRDWQSRRSRPEGLSGPECAGRLGDSNEE